VADSAHISLNSTVVASPENLATELGDEVVLLNLQRGAYHGLEGIGPRIWELIQQPRLVSEIHKTLLDEYEVSPDECEHDLMELLHEMADRGLIEIKSDTV
jgi:Coenzyme PQQ synthesis protein D (PqqD)